MKLKWHVNEAKVYWINGVILALHLLLIPALSFAQQTVFGLKNQMTGQTTVNFDDPLPYQFGLR
ncbi:MAG: hypothetical protein E4H10_14630, partial [Bacteroidia bacterium]